MWPSRCCRRGNSQVRSRTRTIPSPRRRSRVSCGQANGGIEPAPRVRYGPRATHGRHVLAAGCPLSAFSWARSTIALVSIPEPLPSWPRRYFQPGGGDAHLFYKVHGTFGAELDVSRARHRCGGVPQGCTQSRFTREADPDVLNIGLDDGWLARDFRRSERPGHRPLGQWRNRSLRPPHVQVVVGRRMARAGHRSLRFVHSSSPRSTATARRLSAFVRRRPGAKLFLPSR